MGIAITTPDAERPNRRRATVDGAMTIYEAASATRALLEALEDATELDVDLSAVEEIDVAGLQLLVLLRREAARRGRLLRLNAPSAAAQEAIDRLNLAPQLEEGRH